MYLHSPSLTHHLFYVGHSLYIDRYFQCLSPQEISLGNFQSTDRPTFLLLKWNGQFPSIAVWHGNHKRAMMSTRTRDTFPKTSTEAIRRQARHSGAWRLIVYVNPDPGAQLNTHIIRLCRAAVWQLRVVDTNRDATVPCAVEQEWGLANKPGLNLTGWGVKPLLAVSRENGGAFYYRGKCSVLIRWTYHKDQVYKRPNPVT